jgi:hypothetical protein
MSERMIELQRAKLMAAGKGNNNNAEQTNQNGSNNGGSSISHSNSASRAQTSQQAAVTYVLTEDQLMARFFQRMQRRDDTRTDSAAGPTVPTALSRRILQKQGVGYLDNTVGAIASAAADRFLATVLQQAVACRDQRLKGTELAREAARQRKRHVAHYQTDLDDRERRKKQNETKREHANIAAVEAAEALEKRIAATAPIVTATSNDEADKADATKAKAKKKTVTITTNGSNINKRSLDLDDEVEGYDSLDEEEEYYQNHYVNEGPPMHDDEEDDDDMLILRDLSLPLESWDFHITGKLGMEECEPAQEDSDDEADDHELDEQIRIAEAEANSFAEARAAAGNASTSTDGVIGAPPLQSKSPTSAPSSASKGATR